MGYDRRRVPHAHPLSRFKKCQNFHKHGCVDRRDSHHSASRSSLGSRRSSIIDPGPIIRQKTDENWIIDINDRDPADHLYRKQDQATATCWVWVGVVLCATCIAVLTLVLWRGGAFSGVPVPSSTDKEVKETQTAQAADSSTFVQQHAYGLGGGKRSDSTATAVEKRRTTRCPKCSRSLPVVPDKLGSFSEGDHVMWLNDYLHNPFVVYADVRKVVWTCPHCRRLGGPLRGEADPSESGPCSVYCVEKLHGKFGAWSQYKKERKPANFRLIPKANGTVWWYTPSPSPSGSPKPPVQVSITKFRKNEESKHSIDLDAKGINAMEAVADFKTDTGAEGCCHIYELFRWKKRADAAYEWASSLDADERFQFLAAAKTKKKWFW